MGNLVRKPAQILKNTIAAGDCSWSDTTGDPLLFLDYNEIKAGTVEKFDKSVTTAGLAHAVAVHPEIAYPTDTTHFEWYLEVKGLGDFKEGKADAFFLSGKSYQGVIGALGAVSSGKINDADLITLCTSMAATINADKARLVNATVSGKVLILTALDATYKFKVLLNVEYGTQANAALHFTDGAITFATNVIASAGLAAALNRLTGLAFVDDFFNTGYTLVVTDATTAANVGAQDITDYAASGGVSTVASFVTADDTAVEFYITGVSDVYYHSTGFAAKLTLADVQKLFPMQSMKAGYPADAFPASTITAWARYKFTINHANAYALDGANHKDSVIEEVEFYVPQAAAELTNGVNWDDHIFEFLDDNSYVDPHAVASPWGLSNA